jgi:hypothetical protein
MKKRLIYLDRIGLSIKLLAVLLMVCSLLMPIPALAAPYGGRVTSGQAAINQNGATTNINQATNKATINW